MSSADEDRLRQEVVELGASLFRRTLTFGRTGNISVRLGEKILVTATGVSLGSLRPQDLATIDLNGKPLEGPQPSKEAFFHAAVYRAQPRTNAVVHLHSTNVVAVSCLADLDPADLLPPLTPYYVMRVGKLPLLPYHAPGDDRLEPLVEKIAADHQAFVLANHGSVVSGRDLAAAADAAEELEETAKLYLMLRGLPVRALNAEQVADIQSRYGSQAAVR
ncbi:3-oxo-tetronate 4-phosphate decarboxylase [Kineosporia sp. NBRC 101677]|uniref:3-oxo-tetronate 4-phosphate decarboxylase n=1 Tax=Kineosporia sp. NBRC 101677 TaxID=3032197 RepID=UPI00255404BF|nr:3-oxo-tetronate 4-phosphate decarboxylase [Kineosporia sp. NBRC 101677]